MWTQLDWSRSTIYGNTLYHNILIQPYAWALSKMIDLVGTSQCFHSNLEVVDHCLKGKMMAHKLRQQNIDFGRSGTESRKLDIICLWAAESCYEALISLSNHENAPLRNENARSIQTNKTNGYHKYSDSLHISCKMITSPQFPFKVNPYRGDLSEFRDPKTWVTRCHKYIYISYYFELITGKLNHHVILPCYGSIKKKNAVHKKKNWRCVVTPRPSP